MELTYLYRALLRRKWIIIGCTAIAIVCAFLLVMNSKKEYRSLAQLSTGFTVSDEIKLSNETFSIAQIELKFNNTIENITSPKVVSLVSYRLMLHDLRAPDPFTVPDEDLKKSPEFNAISKTAVDKVLQDHLDSGTVLTPTSTNGKAVLDYLELYGYDVSTLQEALSVARYQRTDYINIAFKSPEPRLSAFVVNSLCNEFKRFYGINKREITGGSIINLDSAVRNKKALLDQKMAAKTQFMSDSGVVDMNMESSSRLGQISTYESELINAQAQENDYSYRIRELNTLLNAAPTTGSSTTPSDN
ncbi:MAG: hypothetical protein EON99_00245, partial [Chitinophagaceae bacterium]